MVGMKGRSAVREVTGPRQQAVAIDRLLAVADGLPDFANLEIIRILEPELKLINELRGWLAGITSPEMKKRELALQNADAVAALCEKASETYTAYHVREVGRAAAVKDYERALASFEFVESTIGLIEGAFYHILVRAIQNTDAYKSYVYSLKVMDNKAERIATAAELLSTVYPAEDVGKALEDLAAKAARETTDHATAAPRPSVTPDLTTVRLKAAYQELVREFSNPTLTEDERLSRAENLLSTYKRLLKRDPDFCDDDNEQLRAAAGRISQQTYYQRRKAKLAM